jgi:hypothetical protein
MSAELLAAEAAGADANDFSIGGDLDRIGGLLAFRQTAATRLPAK